MPLSQDVFFSEYYEQFLATMARLYPGKTIQCYEIFMVHIAVVPFNVVLEHVEGITQAVRASVSD